MATYSQANQPIEVLTPLGKDVLLITSFSGEENISHPFHFRVTMVADAKKEIAFDKILGQRVTIKQRRSRRQTVTSTASAFVSARGRRRRVHDVSSGDGAADWPAQEANQHGIFQQKASPISSEKMFEGLDVVYQNRRDLSALQLLCAVSGKRFQLRIAAHGRKASLLLHAHRRRAQNGPREHADEYPDMPLNNKLNFERNVANNWRLDDARADVGETTRNW